MASLASEDTRVLDSEGSADWRAVLAEGIRDPRELCRLLQLPPSMAEEAIAAGGDFPLWVPRPFLERIRKGDPGNPLLAQVLPRPVELAETPGFDRDPLGETDATCCPGLLRKYRGRCVIVASRRCAVHCRFCFRRHFRFSDESRGLVERDSAFEPQGATAGLPSSASTPSQENTAGQASSGTPGPQRDSVIKQQTTGLDAAFEAIRADRSIREVILSGGDPLTRGDDELGQIAERLSEIPHLARLRVHTRLPVLIPQRVTDDLLRWLRATRLTTVMVIHINHPSEVGREVAHALGRLADAGVPLMSQSVLLRGVNDRAEVLAELFERLVSLRVMPYYLHQLDRIAGAAHFEVPVGCGLELIGQLRARLPGYAVPRYVREIPGRPGKVVLA